MGELALEEEAAPTLRRSARTTAIIENLWRPFGAEETAFTRAAGAAFEGWDCNQVN